MDISDISLVRIFWVLDRGLENPFTVWSIFGSVPIVSSSVQIVKVGTRKYPKKFSSYLVRIVSYLRPTNQRKNDIFLYKLIVPSFFHTRTFNPCQKLYEQRGKGLILLWTTCSWFFHTQTFNQWQKPHEQLYFFELHTQTIDFKLIPLKA